MTPLWFGVSTEGALLFLLVVLKNLSSFLSCEYADAKTEQFLVTGRRWEEA